MLMFGSGSVNRLSEAARQYDTFVNNVGRAIASLKSEDVGWAPIGGTDSSMFDSVPLSVIKDHSVRARHLLAYNPLVQRGITIRNAYMWSDLPEVAGVGNRYEQFLSLQTRMRDEAALCTDGAVFYLVNPRTKQIRSVPISRIAGFARAYDAVDEQDIHAFLIDPLPPSDQLTTDIPKPEWFVVAGKAFSRVENPEGYATNPDWTVVYMAVNRQVGEVWGKPNLMGAVYWARAYKTYLEAAHTMTQALARIAFKVNSGSRSSQQAVIQQMSVGSGVGGTAALAPGQELTAVNKAGAGINMSSGTPLAAMVSAALDVPLSVLLTDGSAGGRQAAETALEEPTFKALEARRCLHIELIKSVFRALGHRPKVTIVPLNTELIQRWGQVVSMGVEKGMLHQVEARQLFIDRLKPRNAKPVNDLPEIESAKPEDTGVGPLSDGTNANRDEDGGETVA